MWLSILILVGVVVWAIFYMGNSCGGSSQGLREEHYAALEILQERYARRNHARRIRTAAQRSGLGTGLSTATRVTPADSTASSVPLCFQHLQHSAGYRPQRSHRKCTCGTGQAALIVAPPV